MGLWLLACALLVMAMVTVGGVTRLTRSGLSIVEWNPIVGVLPPFGTHAWQAEFARYQRSPEFHLVNNTMTLQGFQSIFLVEYAHRLLGRVVGVVFLLPLSYFLWRGRVTKRRAAVLIALFALGGLQGALGWYMVKSGLVSEPHVSPYRLTAHLLGALALFVALVWQALDELTPPPDPTVPSTVARSHVAATLVVALAATTMAWGGLMAGLHAGLVSPTFPTMNGAWIPHGMFATTPLFLDPIQNLITVHFTHRLLAYTLVFAIGWLVWTSLHAPLPQYAKWALMALPVSVLVQITLGAYTVLKFVPLVLAAAHQTNAVIVLGLAVCVLHGTRPAFPASRAGSHV